MPAAITLTAELCASRRRAQLMTLMFCGFTIGSASAGLAASGIVAAWGWQGLLVLGGVLPVLLAPVLLALLPESPRYLAARGTEPAQIAAVLQRMAPSAALGRARFAVPAHVPGSPVGQLFRNGSWRSSGRASASPGRRSG